MPIATDAMVPDAAGNTASINGEPLVWNGQGRMASKGNDPYATGINYFDWTGKRVMRWFYATQLVYVGEDFEYDTGLGLSTKYFFLNGERVATRSIHYEAESAALPAWLYRWLTPLAPAVFPALMGVLALALLALLAMGLGVPLPAWAAAPGVALLACALVAYPQSVARAVIGGGGDPEWHGGHSKGILIYGNDHLGSTRVVIDATGATVETRDYAPFGKTIKHADPFELKHRFTSQPYDDGVELYNYGARMYEPRWGRFVSADELVQGFDSQGLNPYTYVGNQPTSRLDPTGRYAIDWGHPGATSWSPTMQSDLGAMQAEQSQGSNPNPSPTNSSSPPRNDYEDTPGDETQEDVPHSTPEWRVWSINDLIEWVYSHYDMLPPAIFYPGDPTREEIARRAAEAAGEAAKRRGVRGPRTPQDDAEQEEDIEEEQRL